MRTADESPSERVLLVVSDVDRQLAMSSFLATAGYSLRVCEAPDRAALELVQSVPHLVILDAIDDPAAVSATLQRIRQQAPASRAALMCAVRAADGCEPQRQAQGLGVDDCLPWPLGRAEFLWRVRALLRWKASAAADSSMLLHIQMQELLQAQRQREQTMALLIHDMKNPLSGVISNVEYLRSSLKEGLDADPELPGCFQDLLQGSRRLYRMVQSLLDINQSDDGILAFDPRPTQLRELLELAHSTCRARLRDKNIELVLSSPAQPLTIEVDVEMMVRLLANLIDNAISATPNGGTIQLEAVERPRSIELRVTDQGSSFSASERARLAEEPHASARKARVKRGLGLRACRVLAEAHGGKIAVEDGTKQGATVCVQLPRPA
jgi:two-component system sensor histidine kinase/response regulator